MLQSLFASTATAKKKAAAPKKKAAAPAKKKSATASAKKPASKKPASKKRVMRGGADEDALMPQEMIMAGGDPAQDIATAGTMAGGGVLTQSLQDLAVPFGLILAKTGFEAWRKKKAGKTSPKTATKTSSSKKPSKPAGTRRRTTMAGGANPADLSERFMNVFNSIQDYVTTVSNTK
jgi:hypothetical protein